MAIADLLMSQHRWGRTRCRRFLASIPMSETKTVGSMTERQRRALAGQAAGRHRGRERGSVRAERLGRAQLTRPMTVIARGPVPKPGPRVAISTTWPSGSRR